MAEEKKLRKIPETSIEKGIMIISTLEQFLDHPKKQFGKIRKNLRHKIELTDEEGTKKKWDWFIQFNIKEFHYQLSGPTRQCQSLRCTLVFVENTNE